MFFVSDGSICVLFDVEIKDEPYLSVVEVKKDGVDGHTEIAQREMML